MYNQLWPKEPFPSPELKPEDVVKIQLDALQNDDITPDNLGIRIAFRFASPANKNATGPLEKFVMLVKNPLYKALIGFEHATLEPMRFAGNLAQQRVTLHHRQGEKAVFVFTLSKQREGEEKGCWMTDGVLRVG